MDKPLTLSVEFREIIDTIPAFVWCAGPDGSIRFLNKRGLAYTGFAEDEVRAWNWKETNILHPDDTEALFEAWNAIVASRSQGEIQARMRRFDGEYRWFLFSVAPLFGSDGQLTAWWGVDVEIDDRKRAEEQLQQAVAKARSVNDQLELVIDTIPGLVWSSLPDGHIDFLNQRWREYTGLSLQEASGWGWRIAIHPDDLSGLEDYWRSILMSGQAGEYEARLRRVDGEYRWFLFRGVPLYDASGALIKWYGQTTDIDDRRKAEDLLRCSEAYLAEAQRLSLTGSFGLDTTTGRLIWSDETYRILQYPRDVTPTIDLVLERAHPGDRARVRSTFLRPVAESVEIDLQHRLLMPDGTLKHVHVTAHPIRMPAGAIELVGAVRDVTAAKQAQEDLEKAFAEIQALKNQLQQENIALREEIDRTSMFEEIVGESAALKHLLSQIALVAPTESTVLIVGETGTGKELVARAIHKRSPRASRPFVSVNCAAVPASLIASELFGHEKGAFTGAVQRRQGRFELAEGGTLFLDEVGELPADTQVALLRVLQEREFERVGSSRAIKSDVRIIAATNRDLQAAVAEGDFRADLFYRLNVFPVEVPPLRDRPEDIALLVEYFTHRFAKRTGKPIQGINRQALERLQAYAWPGNIRELQNIVERAVIISATPTLQIDERWLSAASLRPIAASVASPRPVGIVPERDQIEAALADAKGRVAGPFGAAAKLGMPSSTLESKIKVLGIDKKKFRRESA